MIMNRIIFRQLFDSVSCTYTYLLGDSKSKQSLLIDPVVEQVERDITLINEIGLQLKYVVNTHVHADHITGSGLIKNRFNANKKSELVSSIISAASEARADLLVNDNDIIECGDAIRLKVLATPGHTSGCLSFVDYQNEMVFTGDALLIRGCGRTDFQEGSPEQLYDSIHKKIFTLPQHFNVYPAHDYKGQMVSTIREEFLYNPRLTKSKDDFITIMKNLNLDKPKLIDIAVPANLLCGLQ